MNKINCCAICCDRNIVASIKCELNNDKFFIGLCKVHENISHEEIKDVISNNLIIYDNGK